MWSTLSDLPWLSAVVGIGFDFGKANYDNFTGSPAQFKNQHEVLSWGRPNMIMVIIDRKLLALWYSYQTLREFTVYIKSKCCFDE